MPTVAEILKSSGLTDEQITALDAKVTGAFTQVLSTAQQALDAAELAKRATAQRYDEEIAPALDNWANEKTQKDAEIAFYKAQLEGAKAGGFLVTAAPGSPAPHPVNPPAPPARNPDGTFVANANPVPGSPGFEKKLTDDIANAFSFAADTQWKYRTLYGTEMPDSPTTIIREAAAQRMPAAEYAAKKYDFAGKEKAKREADQRAHDDAIRKEEFDKVTKELTEKFGSNPMTRMAETSKFSVLEKAVKAGERPNPLKMTAEQRRQSTRNIIQKEIAENNTVQ